MRYPEKVERWPDRILGVRCPGGMSYVARRKGGRLHVQGRERNEFGGLYGYGGLGELGM